MKSRWLALVLSLAATPYLVHAQAVLTVHTISFAAAHDAAMAALAGAHG